MLVFDYIAIGSRLLKIRKLKGLTQAEVAEKAELSDRTYADIERGCVNMMVETMMKICGALNITPNDILIFEDNNAAFDLVELIEGCSDSEKKQH